MPALSTIGHSTRSLDELIAMLQAHGVATLADVRTIPRSRRVPQFNADTFPHALASHGIAYQHLSDLGGLRKTSPDSINTAWRNASFRGYADYMQTPQFAVALDHLIAIASTSPTAIMCAEAVPWRCHRSLIADAMLARGWQVLDLMSERSAAPHRLTPFARLDGTRVTYPTPPDLSPPMVQKPAVPLTAAPRAPAPRRPRTAPRPPTTAPTHRQKTKS